MLADRRHLDVAREVSAALERAGIEAAVIGGVAVFLHGHRRTTAAVDVFVPPPAEKAAQALREAGFTFGASERAFLRHGVPVYLVFVEQIGFTPSPAEEIEGVRLAGLRDLVNMKLKTGSTDPLRAQDLADVIGLLRVRGLTAAFAANIDRALRATFRKLVRTLQERSG